MKTNLIYLYLSLLSTILVSCVEDTVSFTGKGEITGKVVSIDDNLPMENVKISTNPTTSVVFTDANGDFLINNVLVGNYSVKAEKTDFATAFEGVDVLDESTINVVFELDIDTSNNRSPDAPILSSPTNNAVDIELEIELSWSGSDPDEDVLTYTLELLNDQNNDIIEVTNLVDTLYTVTGLQYGFKYFWKVTASDGINLPVSSETFVFETLQFPSHRFLFTRKIGSNNVIFSSDENGNELQLTANNANCWRPRKANTINKIAFLKSNGAETHLYTMNFDGSDVFQVSNNIPVTGFNLEEIDISWNHNDTKIAYPNFDKLYEIAPSGSSLHQIHQTANGNFISEIDWSSDNTKIALKTNDSSGYQIEIYTINSAGVLQDMILQNVLGAAGGLDFSFDGNKLIYTRDISTTENTQYRQLNNNIFIYNFTTLIATNISTSKPSGTNDLDPRFSPNEAEIIFVNTSNDGVSQKNVYTFEIATLTNRMLLFNNATMPDWR